MSLLAEPCIKFFSPLYSFRKEYATLVRMEVKSKDRIIFHQTLSQFLCIMFIDCNFQIAFKNSCEFHNIFILSLFHELICLIKLWEGQIFFVNRPKEPSHAYCLYKPPCTSIMHAMKCHQAKLIGVVLRCLNPLLVGHPPHSQSFRPSPFFFPLHS